MCSPERGLFVYDATVNQSGRARVTSHQIPVNCPRFSNETVANVSLTNVTHPSVSTSKQFIKTT